MTTTIRGDLGSIDVDQTKAQFGYDPWQLPCYSSKKVVALCNICGSTRVVQRRCFDAHCRSCSKAGRTLSEETKAKLSVSHIGKSTGKSNGMYGKPPSHGKGVWYTKTVWLRSSYEVAVAQLLDRMQVKWVNEPGPFDIVYEYDGKTRHGTYRPDFYLIDMGIYLETKGYWRDDALAKFNAFKEQYPELRIELLDTSRLKRLGIL